MGKVSKWFSNLLRRRRKPLPNASIAAATSIGGATDRFYDGDGDVMVVDPNKHAMAVATATAAVAEAALAAAKAAAEVVRLTITAPTPGLVSRRWSLEDLAAVKIQSAFRGYLARRALKALKGLVKLQALVRGHFVRKQSADMLRRLQALVRVQHRARANRAQNLDSAHCKGGSISSIKETRGNESTRLASNWLDNWVEAGSSINSPSSLKVSNADDDDEKGDKILQVDSCWKPHSKHISVRDHYSRSFAGSDYLARYSPTDHVCKPNNNAASQCTEDVASLKSLHFPLEVYTAESSPRQQACSRKSPMTPMRDIECSRSCLSAYPSPSYMANTKSSRAKSRSHSVPRQREIVSEKRSLSKRSLQAFWEMGTSKRSKDPFANLSK